MPKKKRGLDNLKRYVAGNAASFDTRAGSVVVQTYVLDPSHRGHGRAAYSTPIMPIDPPPADLSWKEILSNFDSSLSGVF